MNRHFPNTNDPYSGKAGSDRERLADIRVASLIAIGALSTRCNQHNALGIALFLASHFGAAPQLSQGKAIHRSATTLNELVSRPIALDPARMP
ncbi:MAG: hypothetical protein AAF989_11665 [Planctomycetota bacterium]